MPDLAHSEGLITRLLEAMVDNPRNIRIEQDQKNRLLKWRVWVDASDYGKASGRRGTHVRALSIVVGLMGKRSQAWWVLRLEDSDGEQGERVEIEDAETFDARPTVELLGQVLAAFLDRPALLQATFARAHAGTIIVTMGIRPETQGDLALLTDIIKDELGEITPLEALGTIFKTIGRQLGVVLKVEVAS